MDISETTSQENTFKKVMTNLSIYDDMKINPVPTRSDNLTCIQTNVQNVLEEISREALLLQAADRHIAKDRRKSRIRIEPSKTFIALNDFKDFGHSVPTKPESEIGVSDTQLLAFADGAEAVMQMVANTGITQLFDVSFERKTFTDNNTKTNNSNNSHTLQDNKEHLYLDKNNHDIVINSHAIESDNLNEPTIIEKDSDAKCDNTNDNLLPSVVRIKQNNINEIIVQEDNNQDDKTKKKMSIDSTDDSNTMLDDNLNDNITSSPILNKRSSNIKIFEKCNYHLDSTSTNDTYDTNTILNDNITSSPVLNERSPCRKVMNKHNRNDNTCTDNISGDDFNNIILYEDNSGKSKNISSQNYLNDLKNSPCDNIKNNILSSPTSNKQSTNNPLFGEDINNPNNKTKNNISRNDLDDSDSMSNDNTKNDTSPILNKKSFDNTIICEKYYNQNDKNETKMNINNVDDQRNNMRSSSILKRKSAHNVSSCEDDYNRNDNSTIFLCKYTKVNKCVRKHRKSLSQCLPEKIIHKSRSPSPVLNTQQATLPKCKKITNKTRNNKMVLELRSFSLHDFEEFEANHHQDLENIRSPVSGNLVMLNSQIMNSEMCISRITDEEYENQPISDKVSSKINVCCQKDFETQREIVTCKSVGDFDYTNTLEVFVGASNKGISILEDASTKSSGCVETGISKLAKTSDEFEGYRTANNNNISIPPDAYAKSNMLSDEDIFKNEKTSNVSTLKPNTISKFQGFFTANNRKISISEDAMAKSKTLFDEAFKENTFEIQKTSNNSTLKSDTTSEFQSFFTANNKKISISEDAMSKSRMLFDKALEEDIFEIQKTSNDPTVKPEITRKFQGFFTASNKKISISENAMAKSKMLFDEALKEDTFEIQKTSNVSTLKPDTTSKFQGFFTASNKKISISEDAMAKSKMLFNETLDEDTFEIQKTSNDPTVKPEKTRKFQGFFTASNRKKSISEDAMAKSKILFNEASKEDTFEIQKTSDVSTLKPDTTSKFQGFFTASNKKISISEDAIPKRRMLFNEALKEDTFEIQKTSNVSILKPDTTNKFQGFFTASNKKISISEDAIAKSKMLFNETLGEGMFEIQKTSNDPTLKPDTTSKFQGFITANNEEISISEDAMAKSKMLFDEALEEDVLEIQKTSNDSTLKPDAISKFQGFFTAKNKKISISEDAMAKSKMLFNEALEEDILEIQKTSNDSTLKPDTTSKFQGFFTASNKKISISEDAIAKSKMLFNEALKEDTFEIQKTSNVSTLKPDTTSKFQGFFTASNKKISISEDAIAKSKMLFNEALKEDTLEIQKTSNDSTLKPDAISKFQGFFTVKNKKISISEDAMAKSRMLFNEALEEDVLEIQKTSNDSTLKPDTISKFQGFFTANNKKISISEDAMAKSKMLFDEALEKDMFEIQKTSNDSTVKPSNLDFKEVNRIKIKELIDTQVIDNFDQSMFTQEIEHNKNEAVELRKRAGSPILSCPKAKKKRNIKKTFKVPYSQTKTQKINIIDNTDSQVTQTLPQIKMPTINFTNLNKIKSNRLNNRILLRDLKRYNDQFVTSNNILDDSNIINDLDDLTHFKFEEKHNKLPELKNLLTFEDLKIAFGKSVNETLIPSGWIENHFKLILWKLLSYEMLFGNTFEGILCVQNVLDQLKYRFDRELYQFQRPAIRKILECDEPPCRTMVLCVVKIYKIEDGKSLSNNYELDLTDSWYIVRSVLDAMLNSAVENGKIKVGTKLLIHGAELLNCEQGKSPLEDSSAVRLKIFGNSTRRVPWDTKLGFFPKPGAFRINLDTVKPTGGKIAKLRVFVARIYPPVYIEKLKDSSTVTRSERLETVYASKFESEKQNILEKIYAQIEKEFSDLALDSQDDSPDMCTDDENCSEKDIYTGSQLFKSMKKCRDPVDFQAHLTSTQTNRLRDFNSKEREKIMSKIQERVQQRITASGVDKLDRNVVQLLKIRVVDWPAKQENISRIDRSENRSAVQNSNIVNGVISIWKPSEGLSEIIKEGIWLNVTNSTSTAIRMSEIHISAGRQTIFNKCQNVDVNKKEQKMALRNVKSIESIVRNGSSDMLFDEIDTVGLIIRIEPDVFSSKSNFQNVFLTDGSNSVICLNFWGGIDKFGYASLIKIGAFISCSNLQNRMGNSKRNIPHFRVTELSCFSSFPRSVISSDALNKIKSCFVGVELENFCRNFTIENIRKAIAPGCFNELYNSEMSKSAISPFRLQNKSEYDLEKNKQFIETPQICDAKKFKLEQNILDMNLDIVDFESTFSANSCLMDVKMTDVKMAGVTLTDVKMTGVTSTDVKVTPVKMRSNNVKPVSKTAVKTDETIEISPRLQEQKKRTRAKMERLKMYGEAPKLSPITIINRAEVTKSYVNPLAVKNDSSPATNIVASLENSTVPNHLKCLASTSKKNSEFLTDSPRTNFRVRRLHMNPVKLQFENENLNECDILQDGDFADDFEFSPPLSLD